jgi:hypothetical protein
MDPSITISSLVKSSLNVFQVGFTSSFIPNQLNAEYSTDGITWLGPIVLSGVTSPQSIPINVTGSFYLRLFAESQIFENQFENQFE